jgi:hypothetical protein
VRRAGLQELVDTFLYHNITGDMLLQLTRKELEDDLEVPLSCAYMPFCVCVHSDLRDGVAHEVL